MINKYITNVNTIVENKFQKFSENLHDSHILDKRSPRTNKRIEVPDYFYYICGLSRVQMIFSQASKAAIKAVSFLSTHHGTELRFSVNEIAMEIGASVHTVGKLLQTLVRQDVINSAKGPGGGFYLSAAQMNLPIITIVEAMEGKFVTGTCVLGFKKCSHRRPCSIHHDYLAAKKLIEEMVYSRKISTLKDSQLNTAVY